MTYIQGWREVTKKKIHARHSFQSHHSSMQMSFLHFPPFPKTTHARGIEHSCLANQFCSPELSSASHCRSQHLCYNNQLREVRRSIPQTARLHNSAIKKLLAQLTAFSFLSPLINGNLFPLVKAYLANKQVPVFIVENLVQFNAPMQVVSLRRNQDPCCSLKTVWLRKPNI